MSCSSLWISWNWGEPGWTFGRRLFHFSVPGLNFCILCLWCARCFLLMKGLTAGKLNWLVCLFVYYKVMLSNMCSMQFTVVLLTTFSLIDVFAGLGTLGYIFYVCWWSWPYLSSRNAGRPKSSRTTSRRTTRQITTAQTTTATRKKRPHEGRDGDAPPLQQQKHWDEL